MSVCNDNKSEPILIWHRRLEVTDALINSDLAHKNKNAVSGATPSFPIPYSHGGTGLNIQLRTLAKIIKSALKILILKYQIDNTASNLPLQNGLHYIGYWGHFFVTCTVSWKFLYGSVRMERLQGGQMDSLKKITQERRGLISSERGLFYGTMPLKLGTAWL